MNHLYAKSNGERLRDHTQKVLESVRRIKDQISTDNQVFLADFWNYLELAAFIHDFGKASQNFQDYVKQFIENENSERKIDLNELIPHSSLSPVLSNWFEWEMTDDWREAVLSAVFFHHDRSKLYNILTEGETGSLSESELEALKKEFENFGPEYTALITKELKRINYRFFNFLIAPENIFIRNTNGNEPVESRYYKRNYIFLKGLLHRADHFASSLPAEVFDVNDIEIKPQEADKVEQQVLYEINKEIDKQEKLQKQNLWQFRKLQDGVIKGENTILIGSTGIGKTEFAFLWGSGKKMFFTLPMRTMADQIYKRAKSIFGDNVGLLHSSAVAVLPEILKERTEIETSEIESHINLARNLSYPVIISTGDQVLNVALKYPTYEKIMATLGYSNLIVDEIQAYSAETSAVIVKTIEEVARLGGKFLLMTATLPGYIKDELVNRTGIDEKSILSVYSKKGEDDTTKNRIHLKEIEGSEKNTKDDSLKIEEDIFLRSVKEILKNHLGKKVLITINTVKNSQKVYSGLTSDEKFLEELSITKENVLLLHSRFIGKHREEKVAGITRTDIKDKGYTENKILISTQVIEASVNIDYDILITELASLDSLIQRMGRVNRNRGEYETGKGDVYIINGFLRGSERVYTLNTLPLTSNFLRKYAGKTISEKEKETLVKDYYTHKDYDKIIDQFKKNMHALDHLLLASSKQDAQRIFREVNTVAIIPKEFIEEFVSQCESIVRDERKFKIGMRKLLLDYSTSIRFTDFRKINTVELGTYISDNRNFDKFIKFIQLKRFLKGYYSIADNFRWIYDKEIGLRERSAGKRTKIGENKGNIP